VTTEKKVKVHRETTGDASYGSLKQEWSLHEVSFVSSFGVWV